MAAKSERIEIPKISYGRLTVTLKGITSLITCCPSDRELRAIGDRQQHLPPTGDKPREPEREFEEHCHRLGDGKYGFPASGVLRSLAAAGQRFLKEKRTELYGVLSIEANLLEIHSQPPMMRSDFVRLQGRIGSMAYRPEFQDWSMRVPVRYVASKISPPEILNLFQWAGFAVGIGSWRRENNGTFGMFEVEGPIEMFKGRTTRSKPERRDHREQTSKRDPRGEEVQSQMGDSPRRQGAIRR